MNASTRKLLTFTSLLVVLCLSIKWAIGSLFHGQFSSFAVFIAVLISSVGFSFFVYSLCLLPDKFHWIPKTFLLLAVSTLILFFLRDILSSVKSTFPRELLKYSILSIPLILLRKNNQVWAKFLPAVIVACLIFISTFSLRAQINQIEPTTIFNFSFLKEKPQNIVFILFDETNHEMAQPIYEAVRNNVRHYQISTIKAVGPSTASVIPAMLSARLFKEPMACNVGSICSGTHSLDFSKLAVTSKNVDITGFYFPYCKIQGLRYCTTTDNRSRSVIRAAFDLVCSDIFAPLFDCRTSAKVFFLNYITSGSVLIRANQQKLARSLEDFTDLWGAPFWTKGGLLYAHLPIPHPLGLGSGKPLKEDYSERMNMAGTLTGQIIEKLKQNFGEEFILIITSDHSLRADLWCATSIYAIPNPESCLKGLPLNDGLVPFVVASPKQFTPINITSSLGLLK